MKGRKVTQFALILVVHLVLFYFIYMGMLHRSVSKPGPQEVMVEIIQPTTPTPPPAAVPNAPAPTAPAAVTPPPAVPVSSLENAITAPVQATPPAAIEQKAAPAPAAAAPPAPASPRLISSGVEYVQPPQLNYPAMSKRLGERGKVVLRVQVNEKGIAEQAIVQTSSGFARLDEAGRQAALRALFKPYLENGHPQTVFALVTLSFELAG